MAKLCKCGCGQEIIVKWRHKYTGIPDFIHGHYSSRYNNPMLGRKHTEETRKKLSEALKGRSAWNKGKKFSEESRRKMSEAHLGLPSNWKGKKASEETRKKLKKTHLGLPSGFKEKKHTEETLKRMSEIKKGKKHTKETKKKLSEIGKANYKDPIYMEKVKKARSCKPNKPETLILNLLNDLYPDEWKYTGDFSFTINGKCPDFVNCNGQKKIIEHFGSYWHKGENPQDRIDAFKLFGYDTLVIWEYELEDMDAVTARIHGFSGDI